MSKVDKNPYKGARDFYPEDMRTQQWMFDKWRRVCERYGYQAYDAPILERTELYLMKGSQEIVDEQTYTFEDRGGRSVTIRTEMTPTVSRMVAARRQELSYPARWYSIPNLWRYERMQRGRLREFWQLNVDMFGVDSTRAEMEMIQIADDLFQVFKAKRSSYTIKINSRVLVNTVMQQAGLSGDESINVVRLIDKIHKLPTEEFAAQLDTHTGDKEISKNIIDFLASTPIDDIDLSLHGLSSVKTLQSVLKQCKALGITNVVFDPSLMRGFDYYTDFVFEAFDNDPDNNRSMFGGGRYDGLVGQFGVEPVPTVGFAVGDVTFMNFLETHKLLPNIRSSVQVTVIPRDAKYMDDAMRVTQELREIGVNTSVDFTGRKFQKLLKSAEKSDVRFVLIVGENEVESEQYTLKDLKNGKEQKHSIARIASIVLDHRN